MEVVYQVVTGAPVRDATFKYAHKDAYLRAQHERALRYKSVSFFEISKEN